VSLEFQEDLSPRLKLIPECNRRFEQRKLFSSRPMKVDDSTKREVALEQRGESHNPDDVASRRSRYSQTEARAQGVAGGCGWFAHNVLTIPQDSEPRPREGSDRTTALKVVERTASDKGARSSGAADDPKSDLRNRNAATRYPVRAANEVARASIISNAQVKPGCSDHGFEAIRPKEAPIDTTDGQSFLTNQATFGTACSNPPLFRRLRTIGQMRATVQRRLHRIAE
jgi:hypothetical protein